MPGPEELRRTYRNLSDERLVQLAVDEASELLPEAIDILRQELAMRGLGSAGAAVVAQRQPWTAQEIDSAVEQLRTIPCPICLTPDRVLDCCKIGEEYILGCPDCLRQASLDADKADAPFSLLGLVHNPIIGLFSLMRTTAAHRLPANLRDYVIHNPGRVALLLGMNKEDTPH